MQAQQAATPAIMNKAQQAAAATAGVECYGMKDSYPALLSSLVVPTDFPVQLPKDVTAGTKLLWTRQTDSLAKEITNRKGKLGVADNCFILVGPSGVGKSCQALLITMLLRSIGEKVLYIADAGNLVEAAKQSNTPQEFFLRTLISNYNALNTNGPADEIGLVEFMTFLYKEGAVVVMDEQGAAYTMHKDPRQPEFSFVEPNFWCMAGQSVRILMTGSNQADFEVSLNGTYRNCLRFARPLFADEATVLNFERELGLNLEDVKVYCNFVPREMILLSREQSCDDYLKNRSADMFQVLNVKMRKNCTTDEVHDMLCCLFRDRLLRESHFVQIADLGFVYRINELLAFPLCLAAEKALLRLWRKVTPQHPFSLQRCIQQSLGDDFESLIYTTFVRKFMDNPQQEYLPCHRLGVHFEDRMYLRLDCIYNATCSAEDAAADIVRTRFIAGSRNLTILYRCPKNTETVDFCILSRTMVVAVQVSLLSLTEHRKPNSDFLESIGASTGHSDFLESIGNSTGQSDWRYIFVTTRPQLHPVISLQKYYCGVDVSRIRLVDAKNWLKN